jgi:hypothetical protein
MLQGSSDGDPAAPAGFAEALSFTRNEKASFGVLFLCLEFDLQITKIFMWERACSRMHSDNQH